MTNDPLLGEMSTRVVLYSSFILPLFLVYPTRHIKARAPSLKDGFLGLCALISVPTMYKIRI